MLNVETSVYSVSSVVSYFVPASHMPVSENIAVVLERIASAAQRAGRSSDSIALMAVTKTHPPERIREAYAAGLRLFGENRVQEFARKAGRSEEHTSELQSH